MRIRRLLCAGLLAVTPIVALSVTATEAAAATPRAVKSGELRDCVEEALKKTKEADLKTAVDDCHKAPSLIAPATSELFWGAIAWAIVAFMLMKFGFPAVKKTLKAREDRIRDDLEAAEQAKAQADTELDQYRGQLADARNEANRIIAEARQSADDVKRDLVKAAEAEVAEMKARSAADVQRQTTQAMADLQARVGRLSIDLAEKIVERNLDHDTQMALVESYINQVGNN
ncbi:MAG: F0F1 ATP synthase subunit B [Acidimicrobiia bacterium]